MRFWNFCCLILFCLLIGVSSTHAENSNLLDRSAIVKAMQDSGHVLMIRHASAPGFGDPDNFKIGDCSTQRNLDSRGREQATGIGNWLRSHGIVTATVYSSQWCRCMETAKLLDMGPVTELPPLNSFYEIPQNREPNLQALKQFFDTQKSDAKLIIMVTHHVTIEAISGKNVASGDGVILKLNQSAPYEFVGTLSGMSVEDDN
jgi:phosphohistidine phosphatase SixA